MILLSLDFETTGLHVVNDRVIEFGAILYSTAQRKCLDNQGMLVKADKEILPNITGLTGITQAAVNRFGYENDSVLEILTEMYTQADAVIGFNVRRFDRYVLNEWTTRHNFAFTDNKLWIDLYQDLPWRVPMGKLHHVAADHGILNLFPHSALADAQTVLAIAEKYDIDLLVQRAQSPVVVLRSMADRSLNDSVKQMKFRWNPSNKIWWRAVKEQDVDEIIKSAPFEIAIDKGWTPEELDN